MAGVSVKVSPSVGMGMGMGLIIDRSAIIRILIHIAVMALEITMVGPIRMVLFPVGMSMGMSMSMHINILALMFGLISIVPRTGFMFMLMSFTYGLVVRMCLNMRMCMRIRT